MHVECNRGCVRAHGRDGWRAAEDEIELVALLSRLDPLGIHRPSSAAPDRKDEYTQLAGGVLTHLRQHPGPDERDLAALITELLRFDHGMTLQEKRLDQLAYRVHEWLVSRETRS